MHDNLVIVESKTKSGVISKYLNRSEALKTYGRFQVVACFGHVRDLDRKTMSVDTESFECKYVELPDKKKTITTLRKLISQSTMVYLASDNDREGEAIAWHLRELFRIPATKYKRILFNEVTKTAIEHAVMNPVEINSSMVDSQKCRRILDRLVGYKTTGVLWKHYNHPSETVAGGTSTISAGRVQSAILNMVVDKETDIQNHNPRCSWSFEGNFGKLLPKTTLYFGNKAYVVDTFESTRDFLEELRLVAAPKVSIESVKVVDKFENPPAPFITSTLQQCAYSTLKFPLAKTMRVAQCLYEKGLITYMRTDSTVISTEFVQKIKHYLLNEDQYGKDYVNFDKCNRSDAYVKNNSNAQEAHEAIRPTSMDRIPNDSSNDNDTPLSGDERKLYDLIFRRSVAFYMKAACYKCVTVNVRCDSLPSNEYYFMGTERILQFDGWLKIHQRKRQEVVVKDVDEYVRQFDPPARNLALKTCKTCCSWTSPPSRYNESSLVKKLESTGIGRPSTYASIIGKLQDKRLVETKNVDGVDKECVDYVLKLPKQILEEQTRVVMVGAETSRTVPSASGVALNEFMTKYFPDIVDEKFTSCMETTLDSIASGEAPDYKTYLKQFYDKLRITCNRIPSPTTCDKTTGGGGGGTGHSVQQKNTYEYTDPLVTELLISKYAGKYKTCVTKSAKFGPVIELRGDDSSIGGGKPKSSKNNKYIDLKPYCEGTNKTLARLSVDDIVLLLSTPIETHVDGNKHVIHYGRYGFYSKNEGTNRTKKIDVSRIPSLIKGEYDKVVKELMM